MARADLKKVEVASGGFTRVCYVFVPKCFSAKQDQKELLPCVLAFHGGGGSPLLMDKLTGLNALAEKYGFVVAYPEGLDRHWNDGRQIPGRVNYDDVRFVRDLISRMEQHHHIDAKRIYACGISNGGFFSQLLAIEMPGKLAAVASVAATLPLHIYSTAQASGPTPVLFVLGKDDPVVPFQGGKVRFLGNEFDEVVSAADTVSYWTRVNHCDAKPRMTEVAQGQVSDGTRVRRFEFNGDKNHPGAQVVVYEVAGGGHTWPSGWQYLPEKKIGKTSRDFDASEAIWKFFSEHKLR